VSGPVALERIVEIHRRGDARGVLDMYVAYLAQHPDDAVALRFLGLAYLQTGNLAEAERCTERSLALAPDHADALCHLATIRTKLERIDAAIPLFLRVLEINPRHTDALNNFSIALNKVSRPGDARVLLEQLVTLQPRSAHAFRSLADSCFKAGDHEAAIQHYQTALEIDPQLRPARLGLGEVHEAVGRFRAARLQYQSALQQDTRSPLALARLLQLRDADVEEAHVAVACELAASQQISTDARIRLNVALGYYFDRVDRYADAFQHLERGYGELGARQTFDSNGFSAAIERLIGAFGPKLFLEAPRGLQSERPIFIVGMPRSGTTLTEQILASHPEVAAGGELSTMLSISMETQRLSANGQSYPGCVAGLGAEHMQLLANRYLNRLDKVAANSRRVTDKLPFNFMHVGLIALLFPRAAIIHCRRHPLDNCLSCYFTRFADQISFANDLGTLGRYYLDYERLMRHWNSVLPGRILDYPYESIVAETEPSVRRLLGHCGLEWNDACLEFHRTERSVRTPSRWQVRQPIYSRSVGRWRNYEQQLAPLKRVLAPLLEKC
jgi:tetratricopeptide (TPR) repeat protein